VVQAAGQRRYLAASQGGTVRVGGCANNCESAASWSAVDTLVPAPLYQPGFAVIPDPGAQKLWRYVLGGNTFAQCDGQNCFASGNNWAKATLAVSADLTVRLAVDPQGLPHFAGLTKGGAVVTGRCQMRPCETAANWTSSQLASDADPGSMQLGFAVDGISRGHIVYAATGSMLLSLVENNPGQAWIRRSVVNGCGTQLMGANPSLLLGPMDKLRIVYGSRGGFVDYLEYFVEP
jgi:hypothetical protein